ncbi:Uncharacterised protein [uncultured Clostridium sp.]|nr:Uncharacterised protein [uncultured Clostridium sp.]
MKGYLLRKTVTIMVTVVTAVQCMGGIVSVSADETSVSEKKTRYEMAESIGKCNGQQGYDGWYFMYKDSKGAYIDMTWTDNKFKGIGGESVDEHFIVPGYDAPTVVGWEAPYTGTVTLTAQDNTVYRNGPYPTGEDVIATMKLNNEILTDDNGKETRWVFDNTCYNGSGNQSYTVTNLHINKGDMIYHEVDCGTNNTGAAIYWKPIITYTYMEPDAEKPDPTVTPTIEPTATPEATATPEPDTERKTVFKKVDAFNECGGKQGKDGWYFMYKDSKGAYIDMTWTDNHFKGLDGGNINEHFIVPGYDAPAAIGWEAPYTGTVTLTAQDNTVYRDGPYPTGEDVIATMKLNNEILTDDNGKETRWVFDNTCYNGSGNQSYTVTNLHINKGDIIYHEVDCGTNNTGAAIYWKPIITYTYMEPDAEKPDPTVTPTIEPTATPEATATPEPDTERKTVFKKVDAFSECNGQQGYDGWYYYFRNGSAGKLKELEWTGTQFGTGVNINTHFINPDYNTSAVLAWEAPYSGIVTLSLTDNTMYRVDSHPNGGDSIATLKLNDEILKLNNGQEARWVFDKNCKNGIGNQNYTITDVQINKGDILYHEVDCGEFNSCAGIYWKPIITYTYMEPYHLEGDGSQENPYLIDSTDGLNALADVIATTDKPIYSKFTADVKASGNTRPIEEYTGTIDGNNHKLTLRGNTFIKKAKNKVIIKNLIIDGNVNATNNAAAFISHTDTAGSTDIMIENCGNAAVVRASENNAAGFVGWINENDKISIKNSYNYGQVTSNGSAAEPFANADASLQVTYENCYYIENGTTANGVAVNPQMSTKKTKQEFDSGEVTYSLGNAFGQKLTEPKNEYPVFRTSDNGVYRKGNVYTNKLIETSDLKFSMQSSFGQQSKDGWYYLQYNDATGVYDELSWLDNYYAAKDNSGNVTSYITQQGIIQPTLSACIGWKAPMAGKVRLTTGTNIFKIGKGAATTVKIIIDGKSIWQETIPGDQIDESKGIKHDIMVDVGCGDMIYFDVSAKDPTSAAVFWTPQVEYIQTAKFTANDKQILNISEINNGNRIECLFYDAGILEKKSNAYLAFYDKNGTMVKLSEAAFVGGNSKGSGCILSFDIDFVYEDYKDCELSLMIINGDGKNINPIVKHNLYSVK